MDMKAVFHCFRVWGTVALLGLPGGGAFAQDLWDETGPDWAVPEIPDAQETTPEVARARSLARKTALELGATEAEAEQAAFLVPEHLAEWKSPHQEAFEEHMGEAPTDFDPTAKPGRVPKTTGPTLVPKTAPKAIATGKRVLGWHPSWATMTDIQHYQYTNLTTIAYFSYAVNSTNGNADSMGSWNTSPVVEWAHSNGVKVVLTATLFGDTATHRILTNSVASSNLITQLLIAMTNRTLVEDGDGVNIDFEGVGSWTGATAAMTTFMSNLTTRFHAANPNYEVSIALPSVDWYANFAVSNYAAFGMDYAIVMGYDYYYSGSGTPGPVAPLTSSAQWIGASSWCSVNYSMNYYLGKGITTNKLMLGVPYYGRRWAAASTNLGAASLGSAYSAALTYGACETEAAKWGKKWDNNGSVPYYVYTSNSTAYQCFYDDTASLGMKYDLSNSKGMGGIGIWNLTQGSSTSLWSLIDEKFGAGAGTPGDPGGDEPGGSSATSPWTNRVSAHAANFYGVASRAGLHVASGAGGAIYTSTNGIAWTARSSGKSGLLMNANGDGPLWVVVGDGGAIVTSTNGSDWTARTSPTNALFRGVAYGNGIYVACGDGGAIVRSTDGATWSAVASGTNASLQGVGYGMDFVNAGDTNEASAESPLFVIVGQSGLILTSSNGLSWTPRTSGTSQYLSDVTYGNGYYVAVGNQRILRSSDGIDWSFATNNVYFYRSAYCSGLFKVAGANGSIWSSTDGLAWEAETSGTTNLLRGISYAEDQFVAVGYNGTILTKGTMGAAAEEGGGETGGGESETGGGTEPIGTPDETGLPQVAAAQPTGPLSGVVVYTSAGHGFGAHSNLTSWIPERPLLYAVNEDIGNVDQMNRFAEAAWKAGATVVPFRPLGYQTNEVVLDNMDTNETARGKVTFGGTWYNSSQAIFYGTAGDAVPYRYAAISTNGSTSWASYRPNLPEEGVYPVYVWVRHGSDRANQLYRVYHSGGVTDVRVNHRDVGCGWVWLGNYHFAAGTNGCVNIGNYAPGGAEGTSVFADAIRFGNGRGNVSRGAAGISGFESELESGRFWIIKSMGQGMDSTLYDLAGYDDRSDNIGQPARMAAYMCRSNDAARWQRVYVGFHSNAGDGSARGAVGLYDTRIQSSYPTYYAAQTNLAAALARQCNVDLRAGTNSVIPSWSTRTSYLYGSTYGEIYNSSVFLKMDTTINEVAYHDNSNDCTVLKSPAGREWLARATTRGLIKHLAGYYASGIVNTNAPDRPIQLKAVNSGSGAVTVSWAMPTRDAASGGLPQGFILYTSTDGQGFANPIAVPGASATNKVITNLNAGAAIFFRVCATNAGGESLDSAVAGVRVTAGGAKAGVLVVDGFTRNDAGLTPTRHVTNRTGSISYANVSLVRPQMINSFDYVKEHGLALAAAGQTFDYVGAALVSSALLTNYGKVVWILGEESTVDETFSSAEQTAATAYLNAGGRLLVSGAEIGWDLGRAGVSSAADVNFFTNVLHAVYSADSGATGQVTGTAGGFLSGVSIAFNYTNLLPQVYAANYPDVLRVGSGGVTAAVYGASAAGTSGAIVQYSNATYRTVVMGFPFETITNEETRATVMTKAMQFLGDTATAGAIQVTISPAAATNAARWIVSNTTNTSGSVKSLSPGTYQVTFNSVAGYTAPASTSVVVSAGATNVLTATYAAASGSLTVTIQPASAVADGRWSLDGGAVWRTSGTTLSNLTNGTYAVTFQDIDSHTTPAATNVTIAGGAVSITGAYVALVGDLTVNLSPAAAVSAGAQWSVNGGATWFNSGATASNLLAGRQYFTFKAVANYAVPDTGYTTVYANSNVVRSYSYTALPGSITVTLIPAGAIAAGAAWSVDGGTNWNESGATVQNLAIKTHTISFLAVDGYAAPASTNYALSAGEAASFTKTYTDVPGALTVNLTPASAHWSLDGGSSWFAAGATATNLAAGGYTVTFGPVAGYATPAATNVTVVSGATGTVTRTYVLQPAGTDCIASQGFDDADVHPWSWSVVYLSNTGGSTDVVHMAAADVVTNKVLSGANALRLRGSTNGTANPAIVMANVDVSGYTNVTVTVPFAANGPDSGDDLYVAASYDGGATWSPSAYGTQIADGAGNLQLEYNVFLADTNQPQGTPYVLSVADVRTQLMVRIVFFDANSTSNYNDFYYVDEIQLKGQTGSVPVVSSALSVALQPAEAVSAGAQWRVDGGAWRASGTIATGLTAGAHTVSFGPATGWVAPTDISTTTTNGTTNAFAATYTAAPDTNSVALIDEPFDVTPAVPAGWTFSGVTTNYPATYFGRAAPSVKFDSTNDYVVTPVFSGGTNVQFWMRAVTSAGVGEFWVEQKIGGNWSILGVVTNPSNVGTTYDMALSGSATQLRFTWKKSSNNIALDDVIVNGMWSSGADSDGDGMSDYGEFVAGTNPQTNSSVLALAPYATNQTATANLIFSWPSVTGRTYSILRATNVAGPYTQHVGNLSSAASTITFTNSAPAALGTYFYGIGVQRDP